MLPRDGDAADVRWFSAPCQFVSHVMNAFEDGRKIHLDVPVATANAFPFFPDVSGAPFDPRKADFRLQRWTLDLSSKGEGDADWQALMKTMRQQPVILDANRFLPLTGKIPRGARYFAVGSMS